MKIRTSLLILFAVATVASMASCKKNYTCSCHFHYSNYPGLPDSFVNEYSIYDSKSNADSKCKASSGDFKNNDINTNEACKLY